MKKILIVSDFYKPHNSGIVTIINQYKKALHGENFLIFILTGKLNILEKKISREEKNVIIIKSNKTFNFSRGFYSFEMIKDFFLISKKIDIINIHFPISIIFPLIFFSKKPIIQSFHCMPPFKVNFSSIIIFVYFYIFGFFSFLFSKKILVLSKDYAHSLYGGIFNYKLIELAPYASNNKNNFENKDKVLRNKKIPTIGYLGRISEEKGLINLIEASKYLELNNFSHKLIIAGNFKDVRFKKYINKVLEVSKNSNSIIFVKEVGFKEKEIFFNSIDILILPSIDSFEAFGLVQLEAMSEGKLIIASNLKGVKDPITKTGNGIIIKKPINKFSISKAIKDGSLMALDFKKKDVIYNLEKNYNQSSFDLEFKKILNIF